MESVLTDNDKCPKGYHVQYDVYTAPIGEVEGWRAYKGEKLLDSCRYSTSDDAKAYCWGHHYDEHVTQYNSKIVNVYEHVVGFKIDGIYYHPFCLGKVLRDAIIISDGDVNVVSMDDDTVQEVQICYYGESYLLNKFCGDYEHVTCDDLFVSCEERDELYGCDQDTGCDCDSCLAVSEYATKVSSVFAEIKGFRLGLAGYAAMHGLTLSAYAERMGFEECSSFVHGYRNGVVWEELRKVLEEEEGTEEYTLAEEAYEEAYESADSF